MSKYGKLTARDGNSKWFLQKTLKEHDASMEHPWMQMIYNRSFKVKQYAAWVALQWAAFEAIERHLGELLPDDATAGGSSSSTSTGARVLEQVHDLNLARTALLEADLAQLLGAEGWRAESQRMAAASPATQRYLKHLAEDCEQQGAAGLVAHHFLQYNAVLAGGSYIGKMVSEKLCVPAGAPGVRFYAFEGVAPSQNPARVQRYLKEMDKIDIEDDLRESMLVAMKQVYADTEAMMGEIYEMNPGPGKSYNSAGENGDAAHAPPTAIPESERVSLTLSELHGFVGANEGRILMSVAGELLDVSTGREMYGPGGSYSILAGRDVTRCLATMSLETEHLDDLSWQPGSEEDEATLSNWSSKLKEKYPVAGQLLGDDNTSDGVFSGLRSRLSQITFTVTLVKSDAVRLGFDVDQDSLEITAVKPAGLVAAWNNACPDDSRRVLVNDRIVSVNGKQGVDAIMDELADAKQLEVCFARPRPTAALAQSSEEASTEASRGDGANGDTQKCPISGKEGMACPMSMFLPAKPKEAAKSPSSTGAFGPTGAKSGFMAGKSLLAAVEEKKSSSSSWEDSFLYRICPIHWDLPTLKVIAAVACISWLSGVTSGWVLHRMVMGSPAS
eukprot:TRINITY_DN9779_c0_g1_i3.p1 TRINITY_DN9779_c0_g1~~TRINITY_DN9779_c0_g1_i3.p1  ORF type:complete len:616 (-),score=155.14 TRINITY_DN9779_c0_g1_i3:116-1963(-)